MKLSLLNRAMSLTPGGSHTMSKRPSSYPISGERFAKSGSGANVIATDGMKYLDFVCSLGATTLGYGHPKITEAVIKQVKAGVLFSMPHFLEAEVAERLCDVIPCAKNIRFVKTGSEACAAAASIARAYTGRDVILCEDSGYHGWHDGFRVLAKKHLGVPEGMNEFVRKFTYGDLDSFAEQLDNDVAAVMIEPARLIEPPKNFLQELKKLTHAAGALLIYDEMIMGGRHALAGGQEFFNVTPDMATYGKAFGAGFPFAFVAGPKDVMQNAGVISGTYSGDAIGLTACKAMLDVYEEENIIALIKANGTLLWKSFSKCKNIELHGYAPHFQIRFKTTDQRIGMSLFVQECAERGLLFHPQIVNASGVMDPMDTFNAGQIAGGIMKDMEGLSDKELFSKLKHAIYEDAVRQ